VPKVNPLTRDVRQDVLAILHELLAHRLECHYSELPIRWEWHGETALTFPFFGDCSSTATAANYFAHGNDPSDLGFRYGNTTSMLNHAQQKNLIIPKAELLPADFTFFGWDKSINGPEHVAVALQDGTHKDPLYFNMGGPNDPSIQSLSTLSQIGTPVTFVRNVTKVIVGR
jgi:hypothetical protein